MSTHSEEKFQDEVGENVDADFFALRSCKPGTRPVCEAGCEDLLDDVGRLLDHRLAVFAPSDRPPPLHQLWAAVEHHDDFREGL